MTTEREDITAAQDSHAAEKEPPARQEREQPEVSPRVPIFPDLFISGTTAILIMLCVYSLLCIALPADVQTRANPYEPPAGIYFSWYLAYLGTLLRRVPASLVAAVPILLTLLLAFWPFFDRNPSRELRRRPLALALGAGAAAILLSLTYLGWAT